MKVLVVDDELYSRKVLANRIIKLGHEVIEAGDGEEALVKSRLEQPDIIFMDMVMPKMDGLNVIRLLRKEVDTKIIMCSATSEKKQIISAIEAGASDYVIKPIDDYKLENALEMAIQSVYL